jgi:alkanesulfonate monooxygenase SsuD/methylene tetrahydromethanopterin reductase-like flavin-dependent oxidoreductase (luciferase family)
MAESIKPRIRAGLTDIGLQWAGPKPGRAMLDRIGDVLRVAEGEGFDAFFLPDMLQLEGLGTLDVVSALTAVAACTRRLQLGALVSGVTYRNPAQLAKSVTTLDVLSGGRAIFGIGAADAMQRVDHEAYDIPFPASRERYERLEDTARIARAMFTTEPASVEGTHHRIEGVLNRPAPVRGDIPILIGGGGERKTLRLVAQYADMSNLMSLRDVGRVIGVLDAHCADVGRDPSEILRTAIATVIVSDDADRVQRQVDELLATGMASEDTFIAGSPDGVAARLAELRAQGLDAIIASVPDPTDLETLALTGRVLST